MKTIDDRGVPLKADDVPIPGLCGCEHCTAIRRYHEQSLKETDWLQDVDDEKKTFPRRVMD